MSPNRLRRTSKRSPSRILILLSGEPTSIPEAEARSLVKTYDFEAKVSLPEPRILLIETRLDPDLIARRIAYARRVGTLLPDGKLDAATREKVEKASFRLRHFTLEGAIADDHMQERVLNQLQGRVDLETPDYEISLVEGKRTYVMLSTPGIMNQGWVRMRPRARAFFHPSAVFPKLSRALVNLSGVKEGEVFLDPFVGTGSLLLEASRVGAHAVGLDVSSKMVRGALANERKYAQSWLGVVRAEIASLPLKSADGIATDVPYGRASSTFGDETAKIIESLLEVASRLLRKGRLLVVMHPMTTRLKQNRKFGVEGVHHLYIHRKLTRTITVLRRV